MQINEMKADDWTFKQAMVLLLAVLLLVGCASPVIEKRPHVTIEITNEFAGTSLHLYMVHSGVKRQLAIINRQHQRVTIETDRPLVGYRLRLQGQEVGFSPETPWTSGNLSYVAPGDCIELVVGTKLTYSQLRLCEGEPKT